MVVVVELLEELELTDADLVGFGGGAGASEGSGATGSGPPKGGTSAGTSAKASHESPIVRFTILSSLLFIIVFNISVELSQRS